MEKIPIEGKIRHVYLYYPVWAHWPHPFRRTTGHLRRWDGESPNGYIGLGALGALGSEKVLIQDIG